MIVIAAISYGVFLFFFVQKKYAEKETNHIETNVVGTWLFQSSTDDYIKRHQLIILEDSTYYIFSKTNGGGLLEKGYLPKNDSLVDEREFKYGIKKIDTNILEIENHHDFFGDYTNTYKKRHYYHYKDELNKRLKIDSVRHIALGWWKVTKSKFPIKLPNYSGRFGTFTLQIKTDGSATFYLENYLDTIVSYRYSIKENGIQFNRGDVVNSGTKMSFIGDSIMHLVLDRRRPDTLELKKIFKLN